MCNKVRRAVPFLLLKFVPRILNTLELQNNVILFWELLRNLPCLIRLTLLQYSDQPRRSAKMTVPEILREESTTSGTDIKGILFS